MKKIDLITYELNIKNSLLSEGGLDIVFITDLHDACRERKTLHRIINNLKMIGPDLILVGGDMIVQRDQETYEKAAIFVKELMKIGQVYYTFGNHEKRACDALTYYCKYLKKKGVVFLNNTKAHVDIKGVPICISGYDMDISYYKRFKKITHPTGEIYDKLGNPEPDSINILMAHHPGYSDSYLQWGADLTLCGHYHGGVVRIGKNKGLITPDFHLLSDHAYGHMERDGKHVIISAGAGEHTIPFRFFNHREIVHIKLLPKDIRYGN